MCGILEILVGFKIGGLSGDVIGMIVGTIVEEILLYLTEKYYNKNDKKRQEPDTNITIDYYNINILH